jgi:CheY-like chemotaxis protein
LKIVAAAHGNVEEALAQRGFRLAGVDIYTVEDASGVVDRIRAHSPQLVIVAETARFDGLGLCERIKRDPELRATRVLLSLDHAPEEIDFPRLAQSGCDDALLARVPGEELYPAAARLCGLPELSLGAPVEAVDPSWSRPTVPRKADAANLSLRSVDLFADRPFTPRSQAQLTLRRTPADEPLVVDGEVARVDGGSGRAFRARIHFHEMPSAARLKLADLCLWDARPIARGVLRVEVRGAFDQGSEFGQLERRIAGDSSLESVIFDVSRVRQITSWGARAWILFLRNLPPGLRYQFVNGSTLFSRHCGMVADMLGRGEVLTLALPYECAGCGAERARVVHRVWLTAKVRSEPPTFRCAACGGDERFAELPDRYFSFLRA